MKQVSEHRNASIKGRKEWIDALRGLAMIFVVCVHLVSKKVYGWEICNVITGPITITMFFAITGYVFNDRKGNQKEFYRNIFFKIVIPWFVLSLIWVKLLLIPFRGTASYFYEGVWDLLSGRKNWFIPCCICAETIQFYIRKVSKSNRAICVYSIICTIIGIAMAHFDICNFAMINRAFIVQAFMVIGYLFKHYIEHMNVPVVIILFGVLAYVLMVVITINLWPGKYLDVHLNKYYNLFFCFVMIYLGCFEMFLIFSRLKKVPKLLSFIGRNSLFYYMTHGYVITVLSVFLKLLKQGDKVTWIGAFFQTCIVCICCGIGAVIVNRFLPEVLGKRRKNKYKRYG